MPKKETSKVDRDDLIEALTDGRVLEALKASLMVSLRPVIEEIVGARLDKFEASLNDTLEKVVKSDTQIKVLEESVSELKKENEQLKDRLDQLEMYSRADNLVFHGLPEIPDSEMFSGRVASDGESRKDSNLACCDLIVDLCNTRLGVTVGRQDISIAHRLRRGRKEASRPIVVRFTSRQTRDAVYRARRTLRQPSGFTDHPSASVYINEQLTKTNAEIFFQARGLLRNKRITGAWTYGGEIFIKKTTAADEKPTKIRSTSDLPLEA